MQYFPVVYNAYKFYRVNNGNQRKGTSKMTPIKTTQQGLQDGWTRATFILNKNHLEKLKALAYWERKTIKDVIDEALGNYLGGERLNPRRVKSLIE